MPAARTRVCVRDELGREEDGDAFLGDAGGPGKGRDRSAVFRSHRCTGKHDLTKFEEWMDFHHTGRGGEGQK